MNKYEALGRYVAAQQEFIACSNKRDNLLERVAQITYNASQGSHHAPHKMQWDVVNALLTSSHEAEKGKITAMEAANAVADVAAKPKILLID